MDAISGWRRRGGREGRRAQNDDEGVKPTSGASPYLDLCPLLHEALGQVPGGHLPSCY